MSPLLNHNYSKTKKVLYCRRCLFLTQSENELQKHLATCSSLQDKICTVKMPKPGSQIYHKYTKNKSPFVIYADFECTLKDSLHIANSYSYIVIRLDGKVIDKHTYIMENESDEPAEINLLKKLQTLKLVENGKINWEHYNQTNDCQVCKKPLTDKMARKVYVRSFSDGKSRTVHRKCMEGKSINTYGTDEYKKYKKTTKCEICNKDFETSTVIKYDELTGDYIGPIHSKCKKWKKFDAISIFYHNLKSYDAHFLLQGLKHFPGKIDVIAQSSEKFISFTWHNTKGYFFKFLDSMAFLNSSLDGLSKSLKDFPILDKYYQNSLLKQKGFYPYEWVNNINKFKKEQLPSIHDFYSSLKEESITEKDYAHAQRVWSSCGCKTFKDYHKIYLEVDVLLLADVFENFRTMAISEYKIDPANC